MRILAGFLMGGLAALSALSACNSRRHQTRVNLSVRSVGTADVGNVVATVSGPAMPAPKTFTLSNSGNAETWGAIIGPLPVGKD
jgi:hypothetical protein